MPRARTRNLSKGLPRVGPTSFKKQSDICQKSVGKLSVTKISQNSVRNVSKDAVILNSLETDPIQQCKRPPYKMHVVAGTAGRGSSAFLSNYEVTKEITKEEQTPSHAVDGEGWSN